MKCKKVKKLISNYIDDNLKSKQRIIFEQHLKECSSCKEFLIDLQKIVNSAKKLEEISPPSYIWPRIEAKLKEKSHLLYSPQKKRELIHSLFLSRSFKYGVVFIVLLIFLISISIIGLNYLKKENEVITQENYVLFKLKEAEHHYELAIKSLLEAFSLVKQNLDPEIIQSFQENLKIIDASIYACKQALLQEPNNLEIRDHLLFAYQEKVNFLREMINLEKISPAGNFNSNL